ncbi:tyrosine-type recombinase/integrase [Halomicrobium mukohataei]|uniref:Tyrosine-type recombinase/integrase n=1 Tax=Halomicrobium mukohataei TaxID=57705 RepID=A0A847TVF3_9EURY|nr:site-specific integrase [Halomicrobium mukohataei]NLV09992.1 tyrosine-type recombinase/integrase [Halomicrobium mukohataei]
MSDDGDDVRDMLEEIREAVDDDADLEPTPPREAFDLWLQQLDRAESTIESYQYRVRPFLEFCDANGIETLDQLTTRTVKEFEAERRGDLQKQTLNNQFGTIRQFLEYCHDLEAVTEDVVRAINVPELTKEDRVNTEKLIAERAKPTLENLEKYRYASRDHVLFLLLWRTTARIGTLHSLDLKDVYVDEEDRERLRVELAEGGHSPDAVEQILEEAELPFIFPRNRADQGTNLKNRDDGERVINIADHVAEIVQDYIEVNRYEVTDDEGRHPLFTTRKGSGRLARSTMRNWIYILTQPCEFGGECPHDRDPETCEAREHGKGSKCPSSRSPHKIRTGSITWHRDNGWPVADLADKADTGEDLIKGVYDQPEALVRGAARRHHLDKLDETDE